MLLDAPNKLKLSDSSRQKLGNTKIHVLTNVITVKAYKALLNCFTVWLFTRQQLHGLVRQNIFPPSFGRGINKIGKRKIFGNFNHAKACKKTWWPIITLLVDLDSKSLFSLFNSRKKSVFLGEENWIFLQFFYLNLQICLKHLTLLVKSFIEDTHLTTCKEVVKFLKCLKIVLLKLGLKIEKFAFFWQNFVIFCITILTFIAGQCGTLR